MKQVTPEEIYGRWLTLLRNGQYTQTTSCMRRIKKSKSGTMIASYCCLGVLEDMAVQDGGPGWDTPQGLASCAGYPREEILDFMKLDMITVEKLIDLNDYDRRSFAQIADKIEKNILPRLGIVPIMP